MALLGLNPDAGASYPRKRVCERLHIGQAKVWDFISWADLASLALTSLRQSRPTNVALLARKPDAGASYPSKRVCGRLRMDQAKVWEFISWADLA